MDIRIPAVGESVVEALLAAWHKQDGEAVLKDEALCEIETDKITMELTAEASGVVRQLVPAGRTVAVGTLIGRIDQAELAATALSADGAVSTPTSPAVRQALQQQGMGAGQLAGSGPGGRILLDDITRQRHVPTVGDEEPPGYGAGVSLAADAAPDEERVPLSPLRKRLAERLVRARQQTALLTTFNEVDLTGLHAVRTQLKQQGRPVGLLPFFVRAACEALKLFPAVNASIDDNDLVYHHACHIGIAAASDKGLVVPVLRHADQRGLMEIHQAIAAFVERIRTNRLALADLEGGTFTISNGGTYGSLLSTPIINPPQSGVLGMHAIQERPVARDGVVVIRPMMYLALSYDHRLIDGREAVGFLQTVRGRLEDDRWLAGLE